MNKVIRKADIILLIILVAAGIILAAASFGGGSGSLVVVKADGKLYGTYDLFTDREVTIDDGNGQFNHFVIENGTVRMTEASCKNHDCIRMGPAHDTNQTIVCLPNRVSISIEGGDADVDVVSG